MRDKQIAEIQDFIKRGSVTAQGLAEAASLHKNTIIGIKNPDWSPTDVTLRALLPTVRRLQRAISPKKATGEEGVRN